LNGTRILEDYAREASDLVESFERIRAADVYANVAHLLPAKSSRIADIGAGTGRDAAWFVQLGHSVLAVEPTDHLRTAGMALHPSPRITWISDTLPDLQRTLERGEVFDCVILCAVWQHLSSDERARAMPNLSRLLAHDGRFFMILRHEPPDAQGRRNDSQREDAETMARESALDLVFACEGKPVHPDSRASGVTLTWLVWREADLRKRIGGCDDSAPAPSDG
jgi:SAM-dependent methyltransferase